MAPNQTDPSKDYLSDPNELLTETRRALSRYLAGQELQGTEEADELAQAFEALDAWISKGGALPDAWVPFRKKI